MVCAPMLTIKVHDALTDNGFVSCIQVVMDPGENPDWCSQKKQIIRYVSLLKNEIIVPPLNSLYWVCNI